MLSDKTKRYLVGYLSRCIGPSAKGIGIMPRVNDDTGQESEDSKVNKVKEGRLSDFFEKYVYGSEDCRGNFRLSQSGQLWVFNGRYYENAGDPEILRDIIKRTLKEIGASTVYRQYSFETVYDKCMLGLRYDAESAFAPNRNYLVFGNGVLDVRNGLFRPFRICTAEEVKEMGEEEAMLTELKENAWAKFVMTDLYFDFDYDRTATSPLWNTKLLEIIPSPSMRDALQQFCGMMLADRNEIKFEYAAFVIGPGSNGKSVIASAIANTFGSEHFGKFEPKQVLKANDSMFNMAALEGMIANFTDDLSKDDISGGMFKRFVSGEEFPARHPYGRSVFKVKAPLMLCCCNDMPSTTDDTYGHHRRILPILSTSFIREEKDKDARLPAKLATPENRQAIFNWIYEGYRRVVENDGQIILGAEVRNEQIRIRDDSNSARRWIKDMSFVAIPENEGRDYEWKALKDWHGMYRSYCTDNGDFKPRTANGLAKLFREKGYQEKRKSDGLWFLIRQDEERCYRESIGVEVEKDFREAELATSKDVERDIFDIDYNNNEPLPF